MNCDAMKAAQAHADDILSCVPHRQCQLPRFPSLEDVWPGNAQSPPDKGTDLKKVE